MNKTLKLFNDNHWYLIAGMTVIIMIGWAYGMQSKVAGLLDPSKKVTREELQNELKYIIGKAKIANQELDRQDMLKQSLIDAANIFTTTGSFNPMGLLNTGISVAAISFGLDRNRKLKQATTKKAEA